MNNIRRLQRLTSQAAVQQHPTYSFADESLVYIPPEETKHD